MDLCWWELGVCGLDFIEKVMSRKTAKGAEIPILRDLCRQTTAIILGGELIAISKSRWES